MNVLITGGTSGIGLATAALLLGRGHGVAVTGSTAASVDAARQTLSGEALALQADLRRPEDVDATAAAVRGHFGRLGGLFLNAGVTARRSVGDVDEATFDTQVDVNFKGQFFVLQRTLDLLEDEASVVLTIGVGVTNGLRGGALTSATRGALLGMLPSLALEMAPQRVRVNAVSPGAIDTPMWANVPAAARADIAAGIPFGRFGTATEVAQTVAFLLGEESAYITGQHLAVAGGL